MINFNTFHTKKDWLNIEVNSINRSQSHTRWSAWDTGDNAVIKKHEASPYVKNLNGTYRFKLYDNPGVAEEFFNPGFDDSGFSDITVPGNWEVQGFGEPIYTNVRYPWNMNIPGGTDADEKYSIQANKSEKRIENPPYIPSANPAGCYRKWFTVEDDFPDREFFITFDGVETVYYLWINGNPVGYSQDSKLPSEFNITEFIQKGKNLLAVMVIRFADSSYVEDQDYWHLSGIYRSVWLVSKPYKRIADYKITALPDLHTGTGFVSVDTIVSRFSGYANCTVRVTVFDPEKCKVAEGTGNVMATAQYRTDNVPTSNTARVKLEIEGVKLWSPESPVLYTAVVALLDPDGRILDIESCRTGFKLIEVEKGIVKLNGKRLVIHGVNRHEFYWKTGRTVTCEHMLEEIRQMKRMNINAVRTSHYPDMPEWYELCDEFGILLVCECNLETHGLSGMLTHDPAWSGVFLDRAVRMVQNYKNHVSIFSWSLGNESGTGANHAAMYGFIKEYDPYRLCQYEAGNPGRNISDIRGQMYAPVDEIMKMLCDPVDDRPIILVEYLYQIRNSGGGLEHFIKLTEDYPRFQGGFIWDWQDKSLCGKTENGGEFFAYGGDFGESVVEDGEPPNGCPPFMTNNGIVLPDLTWKPVAYEVKQAYCPVRISRAKIYGWDISPTDDKFIFKQMFETVSYRIEARLRENGVVIATGHVPLPVHTKYEGSSLDLQNNILPPKPEDFTFSIPHEKKPGYIYTIEFFVRQNGDTFYAQDGFELGSYQFPLKSKSSTAGACGGACRNKISGKPVELNDTGNVYTVAGEGFEVKLDKQTGELKSLTKENTVYIQGGGLPLFNRPLTGLDAYKRWGWIDEYAKIRDVDLIVSDSFILKGDDVVCIHFDFLPASEVIHDISCSVRYSICGTGEIEVDFNAVIDPSYRAIPRVGLEFVIPQGFEGLKYFGLGPNENYNDRKLSAFLAEHESTVEDRHFAFAPPSECGGHEETRYISLTNNSGAAINFVSKTPFHFDVHHSTVKDYISATHDHKLIKRPESYLHIDAFHGPIGSDMAWSTVMPAKYQVNPGSYHLSFNIRCE